MLDNLFFQKFLAGAFVLLCYRSISFCTSNGFVRFSGGRKNISQFLVIGFVEVFLTEQFPAKFELTSLNVRSFMYWAVQGETAPSRKNERASGADKTPRERKLYIRICNHGSAAFAICGYRTDLSESPRVDCSLSICSE